MEEVVCRADTVISRSESRVWRQTSSMLLPRNSAVSLTLQVALGFITRAGVTVIFKEVAYLTHLQV